MGKALKENTALKQSNIQVITDKSGI